MFDSVIMAATTTANMNGPTTRRMASQSSQTVSAPSSDSATTVSNMDIKTIITPDVENTGNTLESTPSNPSNHAKNVNIDSLTSRSPSLSNLSNLSSIYNSHRKATPVYKSLSSNSTSDTFSSVTSKNGTNRSLSANCGMAKSSVSNNTGNENEHENALCRSLYGLEIDSENQMKTTLNSTKIKLFESTINNPNTTLWDNQQKCDEINPQQIQFFDSFLSSNSAANSNSKSSTTFPCIQECLIS